MSASFPLTPYPQQIAIVEATRAAIDSRGNVAIVAPTGSGKTLAVLAAVSREIASDGRTTRARSRTCFVARAHTQLAQSSRELLRLLPYPGTSVVLGARSRTCAIAECEDADGCDVTDPSTPRGVRSARSHLATAEICAGRLRDIESLAAFADSAGACAYRGAVKSIPAVDVAFAPYASLFGRAAPARGRVLVVDEAHNYAAACRDEYSYEPSREAVDLVRRRYDPAEAAFRLLETSNGPVPGRALAAAVAETPRELRLDGTDAVRLATKRAANAFAAFATRLAAAPNEFVGAIVSGYPRVWCVSARPALADLGATSVVLVSGTLPSAERLRLEYGIAFTRIETDHVVPISRYRVCVATKYGERALDSTFAASRDPAAVEAYGRTLVEVCRATPGGVLCFFASNAARRRAAAAWRSSGLWSELESLKPIYGDGEASPSEIGAFRADAESRRGALLLSEFRSRWAEGVDFADNHARAVVAIGVPFANPRDPKIATVRAYVRPRADGPPVVVGGDLSESDDDEVEETSDYEAEAFTALNQACGRLLRHAGDYGAIVLADRRFGLPRYRRGLSRWMRSRLEFGDTIEDLPAFFASVS